LPTTIGTMILSPGAATALIAAGNMGGVPAHLLHMGVERLVSGINFNQVVLHGMLAFLLFAGALQLYCEKAFVLALSIGATALSTVPVAVLFKAALGLVGIPLSTISALLFGALISPASLCSMTVWAR
jgi:CPA1 family monovalent cation:H+ antiporter